MNPTDHKYWDQYEHHVIDNGMVIPTLEDGKNGQAKHIASIGDWIIQGVKGEFYPCKPDIFDLAEKFNCTPIELINKIVKK